MAKANPKGVYEKAQLLASGKVGFTARVLMGTRKGSLRAGYYNKVGRLERKLSQQQRSPNSGPRVREWDRGY